MSYSKMIPQSIKGMQSVRLQSRRFGAISRHHRPKGAVLSCNLQGNRQRGFGSGDLSVAAVNTSTPNEAAHIKVFDIQEKLDFLKEDLLHLFDDQGIDASQYDTKVEFLDPITQYDSLKGYLFNIAMLKLVFNPRFQLHDLRQTGTYDLTSRWTMEMEFTPTRGTPLQQFWKPTLVFTGTSIYVFNPENGKINRHIDTWDSIDNQTFFSIEGFADFWHQFLALYRTPELETPQFTILKRKKGRGGLIYEVRKYDPFLAVETTMDGEAGTQPVLPSPAGPGTQAFNALARYIFGGNQQGEKMAMTTPVFTSSDGRMQFVIGPSAHKSLDGVPAPQSPGVRPVQEGGGIFGAIAFSGVATPEIVARKAAELRDVLQAEGLQPSQQWLLARYNDPSTPALLRRNEILIPVSQFSLW